MRTKTTPKCQARPITRNATAIRAVAALTVETPDWVTKTPGDNTTYELVVYVDSAGEQEIELDRAEFIFLKAHLAKKRGHAAIAIDVDATLASIAGKECGSLGLDCTFTNSSQQIARHIQMARSIYRLCPDAVVTGDKAFTAAIGDLADEVVPDYRI
jgi:hypothetical protein